MRAEVALRVHAKGCCARAHGVRERWCRSWVASVVLEGVI
jgi:hypothetical protein